MTRTKTSCTRKGKEDRRALLPAPPNPGSQSVVRTVAERLAGCLLAAAQPDLFAGGGGERDRCEPSALMGAVAERLVGAAPAGAPEIPLAGFDGDAVGLFLCWNRFGHYLFPRVVAGIRAHRRRLDGAGTVFEPRPAHKAGSMPGALEASRWPSIPTSPTTS